MTLICLISLKGKQLINSSKQKYKHQFEPHKTE